MMYALQQLALVLVVAALGEAQRFIAFAKHRDEQWALQHVCYGELSSILLYMAFSVMVACRSLHTRMCARTYSYTYY
jgi:hypothetical protein